MAAWGSKSGSLREWIPSGNWEKAIGSAGMDIRTRPIDRLAMPMASAASWESIARSPGDSNPALTITRIDFPVSKFTTSTTVLRGKDLVAA
jgi:hypothetical protein